jgi:hypothetical protein
VSDQTRDLGPVQAIVIAFDGGAFDGRVLEQLQLLRAHDAVRLIDLLFVGKDELGDVVELRQEGLSAEQSAQFGVLVRALIGSVDANDVPQNGSQTDREGVWFLADAIPSGGAAAVALLEHRWAIPLRDAIESAGGHDLVDRWIHREDLVADRW